MGKVFQGTESIGIMWTLGIKFGNVCEQLKVRQCTQPKLSAIRFSAITMGTSLSDTVNVF